MKKQTETTFFGAPSDHIEGSTNYNGGWSKNVTAVDRSKNNGYSLIGGFMGRSGDTYEAGKLYLDCGIGGSRKNQVKTYHLFTLDAEGNIIVLAEAGDSRGWALGLWDAADKHLGAEPTNPLAGYTDVEIIAEMTRRGLSI